MSSAVPGGADLHHRGQGRPRARPPQPAHSAAWRDRGHQRAGAERQRRETRRGLTEWRSAVAGTCVRRCTTRGCSRITSRRSAFLCPEAGAFAAHAGQPDHAGSSASPPRERLWPGQDPIGQSLRLGTDGQFHDQGRTPARRPGLAGHRRGPRHTRRHAGWQRLSAGLLPVTRRTGCRITRSSFGRTRIRRW